MAVFAYRGLNGQRVSVRGTVAAETPRQARDLLRAQGVVVQGLNEQRSGSTTAWWSPLLMGRARSHWPMAVHELSMLLHAGIPMLEALDTIAQQHTGPFRTAMLSVRDRVAAGSSLADALRDRPDLFDAASVHLVEVGENAGTLDQVLEQLADFKQRLLQFKDQVFTALMYPVFLMLFGSAAAIFLMTSVLPPLLDNLSETLDELPWPTRVVKGISDVLVEYGWMLALASGVCLVVVAALLQTPAGRHFRDRSLLRMPLLGPLLVKQGISRVAMIIGTLCRSGLTLTAAVDLAARSTGNVILREALEDCGKRISAGEDVAVALQNAGVFPPLAVRVFSVGQETGRLDEMLMRLSADYERQLSTVTARITALLEPILIIVLACFVGFLLLATILPILEAGNVV